MATFIEANRARLELKMKLSKYAFYHSSMIVSDSEGYSVNITVREIDNKVRKLIPPVLYGVSIHTDIV